MSSEAEETWNVIALGFDTPDAVAIAGLQRVFGIDQVTAERVVRSTPRAVKHDVTREIALWYGAALAGIDGRYELQPSADAFSQTSAGEHVSPNASHSARPSAPPVASPSDRPEWLAGSREFAAPAVRSNALSSGLEIDVERSQRSIGLGNQDPRGRSIEVARASMSTPPPGASQSLPPPRKTFSTAPPPQQTPSRTGEWVLLGVGAVLIALGFAYGLSSSRIFIVAPLLQGVGALLSARAVWKLFSK